MAFQEPALGRMPPIGDLQAALPKGAACLGLYFNDVIETARRANPAANLPALAGLEPRRYLPFLSYPYGDVMRLIVTAGRLLHPKETVAEAVRRVGHTAYDRLLATRAGSALFDAFGKDPERILLVGPRGYRLSVNFGSVTAHADGPRRVLYRFREMPAMLETYQVGVIEGALRHLGVRGRVLVETMDIANADLEITWQ